MTLNLVRKIDSLDLQLPFVELYDFEAAGSLLPGMAGNLAEDTADLVEELDIEGFDVDYSSFYFITNFYKIYSIYTCKQIPINHINESLYNLNKP